MKFQTPLTPARAWILFDFIQHRMEQIDGLFVHLKNHNDYWTTAGIKDPFWDPQLFEDLDAPIRFALQRLARFEDLCVELHQKSLDDNRVTPRTPTTVKTSLNEDWEYPNGLITQKVAKRHLNRAISDILGAIKVTDALLHSVPTKEASKYLNLLTNALILLTYAVNSVELRQNCNQAMRHFKTKGGSYVCKY